MSVNLERYANVIKKLLPVGLAFEQVKKHAIFSGLAGEFCRIEERATVLLNEIDPRTADELLSDWEKLLGIPDECTPADQDIAERRTQAAQKLGNIGGISKRFYEELGLLLGYEIEVDRITDFRVGRRRVGHALTNTQEVRQIMRVGTSRVETQLRTPGWIFFFTAKLPITAAEYFRVGSHRVEEQLVVFSNELLQCTIRKLKPAHVGVIFLFKESA